MKGGLTFVCDSVMEVFEFLVTALTIDGLPMMLITFLITGSVTWGQRCVLISIAIIIFIFGFIIRVFQLFNFVKWIGAVSGIFYIFDVCQVTYILWFWGVGKNILSFNFVLFKFGSSWIEQTHTLICIIHSCLIFFPQLCKMNICWKFFSPPPFKFFFSIQELYFLFTF